jgi:hypothetical protein
LKLFACPREDIMTKKTLSWLSLVAFLWGAGGEALGKGKKTSGGAKSVRAAVLPVEGRGLPEHLKKTIYDSTFQELRDIGLFGIIPEKRFSRKLRVLKKKKIIGPKCMAKKRCVQMLGRKMQVGVIYHLAASRSPEGIRLRIRSYDAPSGKLVRDETETASHQPTELRRAVRWLVRKTSSPMITILAAGKGKLQVECPESDAVLYVNGRSLGKRTGKTLKVSSGAYDIEVKKEGFEPFRNVVVVKPGKKYVVRATLVSKAGVKPPPVAVAGEKTTAPGKDSGQPAPPEKKVVKPPEEKTEKAPVEKKGPEPVVAKKTEKKTEKATVKEAESRRQTSVREPYLPTVGEGSKPVKKDEPPEGKEKRFYQTWWFWTLVAAGAAGGGAATYFLLSGGEEAAGMGAVRFRWR